MKVQGPSVVVTQHMPDIEDWVIGCFSSSLSLWNWDCHGKRAENGALPTLQGYGDIKRVNIPLIPFLVTWTVSLNVKKIPGFIARFALYCIRSLLIFHKIRVNSPHFQNPQLESNIMLKWNQNGKQMKNPLYFPIHDRSIIKNPWMHTFQRASVKPQQGKSSEIVSSHPILRYLLWWVFLLT